MLKKIIITFSLLICACNLQAQVWSKMFDSVPGFFITRTALKDTINNVLYLGGEITIANNVYYSGIVKYNGNTFDTLQNGVKDNPQLGWDVVNSLQMFQGKLYAFGNFQKTGKHFCKYIGRWNGASWDSVNFKPNSPVLHSDVYNNELYVAGSFDTIGGIRSNNVSKFDGINWHDLSFPVGGATTAIKNYKNKLYLASYTGVWFYYNNTWTHLADSQGDMFRTIYGMTVIDSMLYIYGRFSSLGGVSSKGIVAFDGVKWYGFGQGLSYTGYEMINNVQKIDGRIHVTGMFNNIEGVGSSTQNPNRYTNYAVLDSNHWCIKSPAFDNNAYGVIKYNGDLFIYGAFNKCGIDTVFGFAKWNGGNTTVACSNTFSITNTYVGINEIPFSDNIKIFPNPTTSILNIVDEQNELQNSTIEIKNYLGEIVYFGPFDSQVNLSHFSSGMYFLNLKSDLINKTIKVVKQ